MCLICVDYIRGNMTDREALNQAFESAYPSGHFDEILELITNGPTGDEEDDTN